MRRIQCSIDGGLTSQGSNIHRQNITQLNVVQFIDGIDIRNTQLLEQAGSDDVLNRSFASYGSEVVMIYKKVRDQ